MDPSFLVDYEGPASFYKLLSIRNKQNPLFLTKHLKPSQINHGNTIHSKNNVRSTIQLSIHIKDVHLTKSGRLIFAIIRATHVNNNHLLSTEILEELVQSCDISKNQSEDINLSFDIDRKYITDKEKFLLLLIVYQSTTTTTTNNTSSATTARTTGISSTSSTSSHGRSTTTYLPTRSFYDIIEKAIHPISVSHSKTSIGNKSLPSLPSLSSLSSLSSSTNSTISMNIIDIMSRIKFHKTSQHFSTISKKKYDIMKSIRYQFIPGSIIPQHVTLSKTIGSTKAMNESNISMKLSIRWKCRPDNIISMQPETMEQSISLSTSSESSLYINSFGLYFHYLYHDARLKMVKSVIERKDIICCPWCSFSLKQYMNKVTDDNGDVNYHLLCSTLLNHLNNNHFQFHYEPIQDPKGNIHIVVRRDRTQDDSGQSILRENIRPFSTMGKARRNTWSQICIPNLIDGNMLMDRKENSQNMNVNSNMNINANMSDSDQVVNDVTVVLTSEEKIKYKDNENHLPEFHGPIRQYYHARLGLAIKDDEISYDSDHEADNSWESIASNKALDEFEDVSFEEKEFMKLWNTYMHSSISFSDSYLPFECEQFVLRFGKTVIEKNLRHNFALHLFNMWDFGLLRSGDIQRLLAMIDGMRSIVVAGTN